MYIQDNQSTVWRLTEVWYKGGYRVSTVLVGQWGDCPVQHCRDRRGHLCGSSVTAPCRNSQRIRGQTHGILQTWNGDGASVTCEDVKCTFVQLRLLGSKQRRGLLNLCRLGSVPFSYFCVETRDSATLPQKHRRSLDRSALHRMGAVNSALLEIKKEGGLKALRGDPNKPQV